MMNPMKRLSIFMAATAVAAMTLSSCSSDDPHDNLATANPEPPTIGKEVWTKVIYEANPRFFATEDCLNAVSENLQRIHDLGCDILWLMPVYNPSTAPQSIGSPYSMKDFESLNPRYGTMEDLQNLVTKAHSLGMEVWLDWIGNHTGFDHPWVNDDPDRYQQDGNGKPVSPPGWSDVLQLNYNNPGVFEDMQKAMEYWVSAADIDGYRVDYAEGVPGDFWMAVIPKLKAMKSGFTMLAETGDYTFYSYGFDMIYDWSSATTISKAFTGGTPTSIVQEATGAMPNVPDGDSILRYVFNHDVAAENSIDTMYGSLNAVPAAYVCASMLNGTPMLYSSMDATGLSGKQSFFNYTKLTFSDALTPVYAAINDAFVKSAEVRRGELANYSTSNVMMFTRSIPGHKLLVAVNTTRNEQTVSTPIALTGVQMQDLLNGGSVTPGVTINLGAYGYCIYMY